LQGWQSATSFTFVSSKGQEGPGPGLHHFPLFEVTDQPFGLPEGYLKADIATVKSVVLTGVVIGILPGRSSSVVSVLWPPLQKSVAFDADFRTNPWSLDPCTDAQGLHCDGFVVEFEFWDPERARN